MIVTLPNKVVLDVRSSISGRPGELGVFTREFLSCLNMQSYLFAIMNGNGRTSIQKQILKDISFAIKTEKGETLKDAINYELISRELRKSNGTPANLIKLTFKHVDHQTRGRGTYRSKFNLVLIYQKTHEYILRKFSLFGKKTIREGREGIQLILKELNRDEQQLLFNNSTLTKEIVLEAARRKLKEMDISSTSSTTTYRSFENMYPSTSTFRRSIPARRPFNIGSQQQLSSPFKKNFSKLEYVGNAETNTSMHANKLMTNKSSMSQLNFKIDNLSSRKAFMHSVAKSHNYNSNGTPYHHNAMMGHNKDISRYHGPEMASYDYKNVSNSFSSHRLQRQHDREAIPLKNYLNKINPSSYTNGIQSFNMPHNARSSLRNAEKHSAIDAGSPFKSQATHGSDFIERNLPSFNNTFRGSSLYNIKASQKKEPSPFGGNRRNTNSPAGFYKDASFSNKTLFNKSRKNRTINNHPPHHQSSSHEPATTNQPDHHKNEQQKAYYYQLTPLKTQDISGSPDKRSKSSTFAQALPSIHTLIKKRHRKPTVSDMAPQKRMKLQTVPGVEHLLQGHRSNSMMNEGFHALPQRKYSVHY